jgi:hypothetical protein
MQDILWRGRTLRELESWQKHGQVSPQKGRHCQWLSEIGEGPTVGETKISEQVSQSAELTVFLHAIIKSLFPWRICRGCIEEGR